MCYKQMRPWSTEAELRLLVSKGISPLRISVKLKRTEITIELRAHAEGIASREEISDQGCDQFPSALVVSTEANPAAVVA